MQIQRRPFYEPEGILRDVQEKIDGARKLGEPVDYLTFVPDGEPTLDANLGREIESLRPLGIKIAVITNSSLIWHEDVREELLKADWVSLKIDSTREDIWRRINRPHRELSLASILQGMMEFARVFQGELVTETMLVEGLSDSEEHIAEIAGFLSRLKPARAYLSIPTRPPAEKWVQPPGEEVIHRAYHTFRKRIDEVEYLIGYEGNAFAFTGNVEEDLLSITSVHPMRKEAVSQFLSRAKADWSAVSNLVSQDRLIHLEYKGTAFYMRKIPSRKG